MYWSLENVPWTNLHDLNLDWIVNTMKQTVEQWIAYRLEMDGKFADFTEQVNTDFDEFTTGINEWKTLIETEFSDLQTYVQNYFDNLDLNESTRYVINQMIASGEFIEVLSPSIASEVSSWLNTHVTPTTPVVDDTLTISGAAADAKVAGDKITANTNNILNIVTEQGIETSLGLTFVNGRYYTNGTPIGSPIPHSQTLSSTAAIAYDDVNFTLNLKTGYMVAFPSFTNGVQTGTSLEFISTPGKITLQQIKTNITGTGNSFAIMIRTNPQTAISPALDINQALTKTIEMPAMVFNGALHGQNLTLSDYIKAGWYTLNSTAINNATDKPQNIISNNLTGGILQNYTNIGENQNIIIQRYTDRGSYKQSVERTITLNVDGTKTIEDWRFVQTRLTLHTYPTINTDIDITSGYTMGIYRVLENVNIIGASDIIVGYNTAIPHIFTSIMDASGRFMFEIFGTDGVWIKPPGTNIFKRLDAITSGLHKTTWVAIGDSITDGRYSYIEDQTPHTATDHYGYYGYIASVMLGFNPVIEYGYGGMGWLHVANDGTYLTNILDDMDLGEPDLITINLGVNDRNNGVMGNELSTPGDGTISGAIRYAIETLATRYPSAQIILMTPINSSTKGDITTGWSKRVTHGNNLDDMAQIIKYWCHFYSIKCLDALNECPINVYNLPELFPDGLHPSKDAHVMIAQWLAGALPRRD